MNKKKKKRFNSNYIKTPLQILPIQNLHLDKIRSMKLYSRFISHPLRNAQREFSRKSELSSGRERERGKKGKNLASHTFNSREKSSWRSRHKQKGACLLLKPLLFPDEQYPCASMANFAHPSTINLSYLNSYGARFGSVSNACLAFFAPPIGNLQIDVAIYNPLRLLV